MISYKGALVIPTSTPDKITQHIPTAKTISYAGKIFVAVKHCVDHVRILWNLGVKTAPSPMNFDGFVYPGPPKGTPKHFTPYKHQKETAEFLVMHKRAFCFDDMGCGKTAASISAAEYLIQRGEIDRVIVISPISTMRKTWSNELQWLVPHRQAAIIRGSDTKCQQMLEDDRNVWLIVNHDFTAKKSKWFKESLKKLSGDRTLYIYDEFTAVKTTTSNRFKVTEEVTNGCRLWGLTGTPMPNSPEDAYGQGRLICPDLLPPSIALFRMKVMRQNKIYVKDKRGGASERIVWLPRKNSYEAVYGMLQPAIRHLKSECIDMPPLTYVNKEAPLTKGQQKVYDDIKEHLIAQADGETISARHAATKLLKLLQISQGAIKDDEGDTVNLDISSRLNLMLEIIQGTENNVIVFAPFVAPLNTIMEFLEKKKIPCGIVKGGVSEKARSKIFDQFTNKEIKVLVAHPKTCGHGLNLIEADTTIWFGPTFDAEIYTQANNRMNRPGQTNKMTIVHMAATDLEWAVYDKLQSKLKGQDALLELYRKFVR